MANQLKKIIPGFLWRFLVDIYIKIKRQIMIISHKGDMYTCPFCNYKSKDHYIIGREAKVLQEKQIIGGSQRNGGCYKCDSFDRERLLYIYLTKELKLGKTDAFQSVLHVAPEPNLSKKLFGMNLKNYVCGDLHAEGYNYPSYVENMNVLNIPYDDGDFDLVLCNHVLEHIIPDIDAMKEMRRVLRPGGIAILQVPVSAIMLSTYENPAVTDPDEREQVFGQYDHVRIYGQDYVDRLQQAGFKVQRSNISKDYSQFGLIPNEDIFICINE